MKKVQMSTCSNFVTSVRNEAILNLQTELFLHDSDIVTDWQRHESDSLFPSWVEFRFLLWLRKPSPNLNSAERQTERDHVLKHAWMLRYVELGLTCTRIWHDMDMYCMVRVVNQQSVACIRVSKNVLMTYRRVTISIHHWLVAFALIHVQIVDCLFVTS